MRVNNTKLLFLYYLFLNRLEKIFEFYFYTIIKKQLL